MQHFAWKKMTSIDNCFTFRGAVFGDVVEREFCFNLIFQNLFKVCCFWLCQGLSSRSLKCIRIQPSYQNLILSQSVQFTVYVRIGFCRFHFYITKAFKKDQLFSSQFSYIIPTYTHLFIFTRNTILKINFLDMKKISRVCIKITHYISLVVSITLLSWTSLKKIRLMFSISFLILIL